MPPHSDKSYWIKDFGEYVPSPPLDNDLNCQVLVIGGGLAGMSAAWHLRKDDPSLDVALIEAEIVGFGASGRNAGWVLPELGLDPFVVEKKFGAIHAKEMAQYGERAAHYTREIIESQELQSDYRRTGAMRVAFGGHWVADLRKQMDAFTSAGRTNVEWLEGSQLQAEYANNSNFKAAIFEPDVALINPLKQVRELKRLSLELGVKIYEETPAIHISEDGAKVKVITPCATITADRLVIATNAYTNLLQGPVGKKLRRDQAPTIARASVTEPLTPEQWDSIGWDRKCGLMSSLLLMHVMTPLPDRRILFNYAYHSGYSRDGAMAPTVSAEAAIDSLDQIKRIFPTLREVKLAQTWGGQISITMDRIPHLGWLEGERVLYLTGCWAHGLAANHLHGQTISDLIRGEKSDLTDLWFVNRKKAKWPFSPIDHIGKLAVWENYRRKSRKMVRGSIFE